MHPYYYLQQSTLCIKGKKKGKEKGIESLTRPTPKANKVFFFFFGHRTKLDWYRVDQIITRPVFIYNWYTSFTVSLFRYSFTQTKAHASSILSFTLKIFKIQSELYYSIFLHNISTFLVSIVYIY